MTHAAPALIYVLTKKLARLVSIPLTLHRSLAPALVRTKKRDPTFHKQDSAVPEVALASAVIVVMKMAYGLDGSPRCEYPTQGMCNRVLTCDGVDILRMEKTLPVRCPSSPSSFGLFEFQRRRVRRLFLLCPRNATGTHSMGRCLLLCRLTG